MYLSWKICACIFNQSKDAYIYITCIKANIVVDYLYLHVSVRSYDSLYSVFSSFEDCKQVAIY